MDIVSSENIHCCMKMSGRFEVSSGKSNFDEFKSICIILELSMRSQLASEKLSKPTKAVKFVWLNLMATNSLPLQFYHMKRQLPLKLLCKSLIYMLRSFSGRRRRREFHSPQQIFGAVYESTQLLMMKEMFLVRRMAAYVQFVLFCCSSTHPTFLLLCLAMNE